MADTVRTDWEGDVATLTVDRPDRLNAIDRATLRALGEAVTTVEGDARALVVRGTGDRAFVVGADVSELVEMDPEDAAAFSREGQALVRALREFPAPTIAAIDGYALGAGMELALGCDLRVASERAVLGFPEVELGVVPAWGGTTRLPDLVDDETARRLLFFGDRVDATDAQELGIVGDVLAHDQLDDHAAELAADLADRPRGALRATKAALDGDETTERAAFAGLFGTHDQREGMRAFLEDRDPDFQ